MSVAIADAYRSVNVTGGAGSVPGTSTSQQVDGTLNMVGGFGISLVADPVNNKVTIVNTGNGTGALTTITDQNANSVFYPIFTRAPAPGDINPITSTYQMDTMYLDQTTNPLSYNPGSSTLTCSTFNGALTGNATTASSAPAGTLTGTALPAAVVTSSLTRVGTIDTGTWSASFGAVSGANLTNITAGNLAGTIPGGVLGNSSLYVGTTQIALNRPSSTQTLTGTNIDGNAATVTNGLYTTSSFNLGTTSIPFNRTSISQTLSGVSIDGSAGTVPASGVTGTTLASGVTDSSLTSVGTLVNLTVTNTISGSINGNAATVTNGVYTSGDQTIAGTKTFSSTITGSISGNAGTVTNGFYTTSSFNLGTTVISVNRTSAAQSLTGVSIDGSAAGIAGGTVGSVPYQSAVNTTLFVTGNTTTTPQFVTSTGTGSVAQAPTLTSSTGTGNVVLSTNPTITAPTRGNVGNSSLDTNITVDAATTEFFVNFYGTTATTRDLQVSNLTTGRKIVLFIRNNFTSNKNINILVSTTTSGFTALNIVGNFTGAGIVGQVSQSALTPITLIASGGSAAITVFNAGGQLFAFAS